MHIAFSPVRTDRRPVFEKSGDILVIDGEAFDFSGLPEGGRLPSEAVETDWITGCIERRDGLLSLTLLLPHGADAPGETLFPVPVTVTADGPIPQSPYETEPAE